jgi:hypothetical protein
LAIAQINLQLLTQVASERYHKVEIMSDPNGTEKNIILSLQEKQITDLEDEIDVSKKSGRS